MQVYIGYDAREADAFRVARSSLIRHLSEHVSVHALVLQQVQADDLYRRPTERIAGRMIDVLSRRSDYRGECSTEFALSRFLVPHLAKSGWAAFIDCDVLVRRDFCELFKLCDPSKALMCVQHDYRPTEDTKMDDQKQSPYFRKNWSSVMVFNCDHPANKRLTIDYFNNATGLVLHQFGWLADDDIGALPQEWNVLVGETKGVDDPAIVHFTRGAPNFNGYEQQPFADEWRAELAVGALSLPG